MASEVFYTVCFLTDQPPPAVTEAYTFRPAILHGYCRRRVRYADYPGIIEDPEHVVRGTVVTGLTDANMAKLDYFEGSEYERRRVKVRVLSKVGNDKGEGNEESDEEVTAEVYVIKDAACLENREWDFEEFRREKMRNWTREGYVFDGMSALDPGSLLS